MHEILNKIVSQFFHRNFGGQSQWDNIFKLLKENIVTLEPTPHESVRNMKENFRHSQINKSQGSWIPTGPALQEKPKGVLQVRMEGHYTVT